MEPYCQPCDKKFGTARDLRNHLTSLVHGNGADCDDCLQIQDDVELIYHAWCEWHLLYCDQCPGCFGSKAALSQHKEEIHSGSHISEAGTRVEINGSAFIVNGEGTMTSDGSILNGSFKSVVFSDSGMTITTHSGHNFHTIEAANQHMRKSNVQPEVVPSSSIVTGGYPSLNGKEAARLGGGADAPHIFESISQSLFGASATVTTDSIPYPPTSGPRHLHSMAPYWGVQGMAKAGAVGDHAPFSSFSRPEEPINDALEDLSMTFVPTSGSYTTPATNPADLPNTAEEDSRWSRFHTSEDSEMLGQLLAQACHASEELEVNGYRLTPYTAEEIDGLLKCQKCGNRKNTLKKAVDPRCHVHPQKKKWDNELRRSVFACCGTTANKRGCIVHPNPLHDFGVSGSDSKFHGFELSPIVSPGNPRFRAVVLDCEMAGVAGSESEVILICAADFFSGAILLNKYVFPHTPVEDWRSRIHGIKSSVVMTALENGDALAGWSAARHEMWKLIDTDTVLIGHGLNNDLQDLRMIHPRVVDTCILTRNAVKQGSLEALCGELLRLKIRDNDRNIHDCEEDVMATREVLLWCLENSGLLKQWKEADRGGQRKRKMEQVERKRIEESEKRAKVAQS